MRSITIMCLATLALAAGCSKTEEASEAPSMSNPAPPADTTTAPPADPGATVPPSEQSPTSPPAQ